MAYKLSKREIHIRNWAGEMINRAPEWIHVIDQDGRILYANRSSLDAGESARADNQTIFDFVLPEHQGVVRRALGAALISGSTETFESTLIIDQKEQRYQTHVIPLNVGGDETTGNKHGLLALFHREAFPSWAAHEALRQRTGELEKQLAERNQTLDEYARYLDASGKLNIQLTRLNKISVVLQTLAEQVQTAMNSGFSAIYRVDKDWIEYVAGVKSPVLIHQRECLDETGMLGQLLQTNNVQFIQRLDEKTAQRLWRSLPREYDICSLLIAPVNCAGIFNGILYLGYNSSIRFGKKDELVLRAAIEATNDTLHRIHVARQLERNIRSRGQEISLLYDLSTYSSESIALDELLQKSLRRIMVATQCDTGLVYRTNAGNSQKDMISCLPQTGIPASIKLFLRENESPKWSGQNKPYTLNNLPPDNLIACMTVPVPSKGRPACFLRLFGDPEHLHQAEVVHLIISAARQMGLSIDSALDRKLAEEVVILEERQRMARSLHDSITQSLYAVSLSSDVALKAFNRQEAERLRSALEDVTNSSLQALKEMRLMLFELRPAALEEAGLIEALELRLNTVERRSGMEAYLECAGKLNIPDALEVELYNIISEALNNSLRHSGALCVWVRIQAAAHSISVEIEDNGKGFEMATLDQGGIGLSSMNERARKLGGNLTISSKAGQGTRITFKVRPQGG